MSQAFSYRSSTFASLTFSIMTLEHILTEITKNPHLMFKSYMHIFTIRVAELETNESLQFYTWLVYSYYTIPQPPTYTYIYSVSSLYHVSTCFTMLFPVSSQIP